MPDAIRQPESVFKFSIRLNFAACSRLLEAVTFLKRFMPNLLWRPVCCGVSRLGCALMLNSGIVLAVCWRRIDRTGPLEWLFSILVLTEINVEMCGDFTAWKGFDGIFFCEACFCDVWMTENWAFVKSWDDEISTRRHHIDPCLELGNRVLGSPGCRVELFRRKDFIQRGGFPLGPILLVMKIHVIVCESCRRNWIKLCGELFEETFGLVAFSEIGPTFKRAEDVGTLPTPEYKMREKFYGIMRVFWSGASVTKVAGGRKAKESDCQLSSRTRKLEEFI